MTNSITNAIKDVGGGGGSSAPTKIKLLQIDRIGKFYAWSDLDGGYAANTGSIAFFNLADTFSETGMSLDFMLTTGNNTTKFIVTKEANGSLSIKNGNNITVGTVPAADVSKVIVSCIFMYDSMYGENKGHFFVGRLDQNNEINMDIYGAHLEFSEDECHDYDQDYQFSLRLYTYIQPNIPFGSFSLSKNDITGDSEGYILGNQASNFFEFSVA